jgi:hypothetical protein
MVSKISPGCIGRLYLKNKAKPKQRNKIFLIKDQLGTRMQTVFLNS